MFHMLLELIIFLYVVYFSYTVLKYAITVIFYLYVCWLLLLMLLLLHQPIIITTTTPRLLLHLVIIPFHLKQLLIYIIQYKWIIKTHYWLYPLILHLFLFYLWLYQSISMHLIPSLTTTLLCVCFCWLVMKCICYKIIIINSYPWFMIFFRNWTLLQWLNGLVIYQRR